MPLLERLPLSPATRQWDVWSTTARIVVTDPQFADGARELIAAQLDAVDLACSRFRDDSELAEVQRRLRDHPDQAVTISSLLAALVDAALRSAERTGGDVDPTLADDLTALGYDRDYAMVELQTSTASIPLRLSHRIRHDWRDLRLDGRQLWMPARVHLDLGASAKAFAADQAAEAVAQRFGCGVLVALGGDIATAGPGPWKGWQILVQDGELEPAAQVRLDAGALATSSTISRRWRNGTSAVHHILDPASGRPAAAIWRTVSVAADTCIEANALTTAAIVRGWNALPELRSSGHPARLVGASGEIITLGGWPTS
jgi:thiamine biosynthesis lipoprotein